MAARAGRESRDACALSGQGHHARTGSMRVDPAPLAILDTAVKHALKRINRLTS